ncbi:MBL fold metallo-hydrolase [Alloalcanivorax xenomutans]|uniref:MBL fold metallo-hydrolase n=1 Tax=Alloalcanivorax xenomutans TaxID=1094342 RepID=UPI0009B5F917|nr:MBL fold metallo-hydrolase [Alloalcanivorax xenomutans]ARB46816.1 beta-lactamase [Alloalcanivorax xenomutans]
MTRADILFQQGDHVVARFHDLVQGEGVQANQFAIRHGEQGALIDPGGDLTYTPLTIELSRHLNLRDLTYILASHQDPDIIASLLRWMLHSQCKVAVSRLWSRFLPHLASTFVTSRVGEQWQERILALPDKGAILPFADSELWALPAHFLHSVGNFSFYDPLSRILFSGDIGASLGGEEGEVSRFEDHIPAMAGFHRRYMAGNRACRYWVRMVRELNPAMIVPQHGGYFASRVTIGRFLDWLERLECGPDLMGVEHYRLPGRVGAHPNRTK